MIIIVIILSTLLTWFLILCFLAYKLVKYQYKKAKFESDILKNN